VVAGIHSDFINNVVSQKFSNLGSQIGDERPIAQVRFAPNNEILATGSWSGTVKLWNVPACTEIRALRGRIGIPPRNLHDCTHIVRS